MGKRIFFLVLFAFLGLSILAGCQKAEKPTESEIIESLFDPTVMITVGEYRASGVIIDVSDTKITIASVAHLLDGFDQGIISFYSGKVGFANVTYINMENDICLLTINNEDMDKRFVAKLKAAKIDLDKYEALKRDDTVYVCGSAVAVAGNVCKGTFVEKDYYVPEYDQYLIYLYCDVFEGMSGAGCYMADGTLLGIISAGSDSGEALCIPITDVLGKMEVENNDKN